MRKIQRWLTLIAGLAIIIGTIWEIEPDKNSNRSEPLQIPNQASFDLVKEWTDSNNSPDSPEVQTDQKSQRSVTLRKEDPTPSIITHKPISPDWAKALSLSRKIVLSPSEQKEWDALISDPSFADSLATIILDPSAQEEEKNLAVDILLARLDRLPHETAPLIRILQEPSESNELLYGIQLEILDAIRRNGHSAWQMFIANWSHPRKSEIGQILESIDWSR